MYVRTALVLASVLVLACGRASAAFPPPQVVHGAPSTELAAGQEEVTLEIVELMCNPCAAQIVGKSRLLPGVTHVSMELATKTLTLRFDTQLTGRERVIAAVEEIVASVQ